jgi:hypothetical protein
MPLGWGYVESQPKGMGLVIEKCAKALEIILRQ